MLNMKDQRKCMVHFEGEGMFPKVHWRILDDSGRFLVRIARGFWLIGMNKVSTCLYYNDSRLFFFFFSSQESLYLPLLTNDCCMIINFPFFNKVGSSSFDGLVLHYFWID